MASKRGTANPRLCACGCGQMAPGKWNKNTGQYATYIRGHSNFLRSKRPPKEKLEHQYLVLDESMAQVGQHYGVHRCTVWHWIHKYGIKPKSKGRKGSKHPRYKGWTTDKQGYLIHRAYPYNGKRQHRLIAEQMLNRPLRKDEVVHHINGDKADNRPENLEVLSRDEHNLISWIDAIEPLAKRFPHRIPEIKAKINEW